MWFQRSHLLMFSSPVIMPYASSCRYRKTLFYAILTVVISPMEDPKPMTDKNDDLQEWTVEQVLKAMTTPEYPEYVLQAVEQLQIWMNEKLSAPGDEGLTTDYDRLYAQLDWIRKHAAFLGEDGDTSPSEAVVVSLEPSDQDEAMRMAIDHVAIFNRNCQRIWLLSDSWVPGEVLRYQRHIRALEGRNVSFRFLLITPCGWTEIPLRQDDAPGDSLGWNSTTTGVLGRDRVEDKDGEK
ncbi:MAG: hypothetical protein CSA35_00130 [Dethiosulfovibrio peptidovorans]|nr:MAG: hypothetical protein CSA35_00130 [Dethiosulfovibrio peptidovorans]